MREYTQQEAEAVAEKATAKAERLEGWADSNARKADERQQRSRDATAGIPFGQPILVVHHSAKRHRNALKRSRNNMDKAVEHSNEAKHQEAKAARQRSKAAEALRRGDGPRYRKADLEPGDRLVTTNGGTLREIVIRANAKSVTTWATHAQDVTDPTEPSPIWPQFEDKNPQRIPYLKIRAAYRLIDDKWTEIDTPT